MIKGYAGATYASDDYMSEFFGVSAVQSANAGLPVFGADAGIKNVTLSLSSGFDIDESWVIGARIIYSRLVGDAADSPIVDQRGSANQITVGVGLSAQTRQSLEDQLESSQRFNLTSQVAAGAVHDINNLLTTILGNVVVFIGPAVLVVALKSLFETAKD